MFRVCLCSLLLVLCAESVSALECPDIDFKIYQFPHDMIPRIDGDPSDWAMVPDEYVYGTELLHDTDSSREVLYDPADLDIKVKVGWIKGLNRLYFLYEAYDDIWDFAGEESDVFEVAVDGDLSGGPFIKNVHPDSTLDVNKLHFTYHGVHAQNYHFNVPPGDKHWCFVWGGNPWISYFPQANGAYNYNFKQGESGVCYFEFYITVYDYAPWEGPEYAIESRFEEGATIALAWNILEHEETGGRESHWTLSPDRRMVYDGSYMCGFTLMPLEVRWHEPLECTWSFKYVDMDRRQVAFIDESYGEVTSWHWEFGDGTTSNEQHPIHEYRRPGVFNVNLTVSGPAGKKSFLRRQEVAAW